MATRSKALVVLALGIIAILVSACGGGGSRSLSATAMKIQEIQRRALLSMASSGMGGGFMFGGGGGTTGGTTGSGGGSAGTGVSSMGGFLRNLNGPGGLRFRIGKGGTTGGTSAGTSTTGVGGGEDFYFDPWLNLWVQISYTETTFSCLFYTDQAKMNPAGFVNSTFTGDWMSYPNSYESEYAYTAGSLAGSHGNYSCVFTSETDGSMTYNNTYADLSHDEGASTWSAEGSQSQSSWTSSDGRTYQDSGTWNADGSGDYQCSNSDGWAASWHYNADWSGYADFTGPDPRLPAHMTWTSDGRYRVVYADGVVETWSWEDFWGEGSSGTTGSGTSGSTGG